LRDKRERGGEGGGERNEREREMFGTFCVELRGERRPCIKNDNLSYVSYVRPDKI